MHEKHKYNYIMDNKIVLNEREVGSVNKWLVVSICFILLFVATAAFSVWSFINYIDQKTDVDSRVESAVALARKEQADDDEEKFSEREKQPKREFVGPDDYGRVTFDYPKTWSVFVNKDASKGGDYEAYLNPVAVPPITSGQLFALRVTIKQADYDTTVTSFSGLVKTGKLSSSTVSADGSTGTRFDGNFSENLRGSLVVFKIRDKVLIVRTDANTFSADFDAIIASMKFNQ